MTYCLVIVFDKDAKHVLMERHVKLNAYNFPGGKIEAGETEMEASYRELFEGTGISKDDVDLTFLRHESVSLQEPTGSNVWSMYIVCGVLKNDVKLVPEKNLLLWVDVTNIDLLLHAYGHGNCYTFMVEAANLLGVNIS